MYILKISSKAFIRLEQNGDVTIVSNINRATAFNKMGDAMRVAVQINNDLDTDLVKVFSL